MVNLKEIVASFLIESDLGQAEYFKCYHLGIRGIKEVSKLLKSTTVRELLEIEHDYTAKLPKHHTKILGVGRVDKTGKIKYFDKDLGLGTIVDDCSTCGCYHCRCNITNDTYNIVSNRIHLNVKDVCDIVVEYSTPFNFKEGSEIEISPVLENVVLSYIRWMYHATRKNQDKWDKQYYENMYNKSLRQVNYIINSPSAKELIRQTFKSNRGWMVNWEV